MSVPKLAMKSARMTNHVSITTLCVRALTKAMGFAIIHICVCVCV